MPHPDADATCPAGTPTTRATTQIGKLKAESVHFCPDWLNESDAKRRTFLLLEELALANGAPDRKTARQLAGLAQAIFNLDRRAVPSLDEILGEPVDGFRARPGRAPPP